MYTQIENDVFDIANRLRAVNPEYRVYWNSRVGRFEIHRTATPRMTTCEFIAPNNTLDERVILHATKTRIENRHDIELESDAHNAAIEQSAHDALNRELIGLQSRIQYAGRVGGFVKFNKTGEWI